MAAKAASAAETTAAEAEATAAEAEATTAATVVPQHLKLEQVLMTDPDNKAAFVLCTHPSTAEKAVVCLHKKAWTEEDLRMTLTGGGTELDEFHRNDKFSKYMARPPARANETLITLICPANEIDIAKYSSQNRWVVREDAGIYSRVTKPHVDSIPAKQTAWVRAILERKAEMDTLIYEDDHCMLLPDTKWDRTDVSALYTLAILKDGSLRSVRDLTGEHLHRLRAIREGVLRALQSRYGVPPGQLRAYFHYLPSFWHAHIHFSAITCPSMSASVVVGKALLLDDVIDFLERDPQHFQKAALTIVVGERDSLYNKLAAAGAIRDA